jgi:GTP-binding protein Era
MMAHKAGFINIIGNPNVGKSTLMNALVGEKLSIITPKAQTTRHRIMGIVNGDDFQIVYSDTPGIIKPQYKLHESMMKHIDIALTDADVFLYLTDIQENDIHKDILDKINHSGVPVIIAINKVDLSDQEAVKEKILFWQDLSPNADVIPIAALLKYNLDTLLARILDKLPESPPFFPKDQLTDKTMRFFVSEIIREKIFLKFYKEIPYSSEVTVETFKEKENIIYIAATIHVIRESQKAIILGHRGEAIRSTGIAARKAIEEFTGRKVYLELTVKVSKDWRDNQSQLKRFGYEI